MPHNLDLRDRIRLDLPHLAEDEVAALALVVERLVDAYRPKQIYLFGSKARDDHGPDSDFDLMVVVPDDAEERRKRSQLAYERLWGMGTAADVLVWFGHTTASPAVPTCAHHYPAPSCVREGSSMQPFTIERRG